MNDRPLHLLLIEDSADDAGLLTRTLEQGGYALDMSRVASEEELREALASDEYDLAISDHVLGGFDSTDVLAVLAELSPDLPCVLVSGKVGEEAVGQAMRQGAVDYVAKDNIGRLPMVVERTLAETTRRRERRATDDALARSGRLFAAVFANTRDAMLIVDDERRVVDTNPAAAAMLATPRHELTQLRMEELMPGASRAGATRVWDELLDAGEQRGEVELMGADGTLVATEYTMAADFLPDRHIIVMRDIRERRVAETELNRRIAQQEAMAELGERALRERSLAVLMDATVARVAATLGVEIVGLLELRVGELAFVIRAEVGVPELPTGARFPYGSPASSQANFTVRQGGQAVLVEDYEQEKRFDKSPIFTDLGVRSALSVEIPGSQHSFGVLEAASREPGAFNAADASFLTSVAHLLAVALERATSEEEIREQALHDPLTGLANRTLFFDRLTLGLARTKRAGTRLAVMFLDIDHFKELNDTLGHLAADWLLTQVGARVEEAMRETDTVARFGGDEFVVLCEDLAGDKAEEVGALTTRLLSALEAPFSLDDEQHKLTASVGVALSNGDDLDGETLLRDADIALYRSKEAGRGGWTLATEEMRLAVVARSDTKHALERAIENDELLLHYQPIVSLDGGQLCAVEALVRWQDPERGLIPPGEFIPLAEESGLILTLGEWVLRAACRQAALWRAEFGDKAPLPIHVNFSARQIAQLDLPQLVGDVLRETGVPAADIALEITETVLMDSAVAPTAVLSELKSMGVTVVLDDFGTGYSSLSYLQRFPIDTLKIDRAFVSPLTSPNAPGSIVTAIVGIARALAVGTVAEGVETAEQAAAVAAIGSERAQGYFFARPAPADEVAGLVRDDTPLRERAAEARALVPGFSWAGPHNPAPHTGVPASIAEARQSFLAALLAVDFDAAEEVVYAALSAKIEPDTIDAQIIGPAMVEVGGLWERGEVSVADEHLATGIASQAAGLVAGARGFLSNRLSVPLSPQTVLLANVDGEDHVLGLRMVADMLQSLGHNVRYLGRKVPSAELCSAAAEIQPDFIGLSLTVPTLAPRMEEQAAALRAVCPRAHLLLGGQAVSPEMVERTGATFVRDVEELVEMASNWPFLEPALAGSGSR
jgi:diguanylate cyclase (GGDEF)-like protein/PAS domain S-box-containing protein